MPDDGKDKAAQALGKKGGAARAMAAGLSDTVHDLDWVVGLIDENEPAPKPRGPYKKRIATT